MGCRLEVRSRLRKNNRRATLGNKPGSNKRAIIRMQNRGPTRSFRRGRQVLCQGLSMPFGVEEANAGHGASQVLLSFR